MRFDAPVGEVLIHEAQHDLAKLGRSFCSRRKVVAVGHMSSSLPSILPAPTSVSLLVGRHFSFFMSVALRFSMFCTSPPIEIGVFLAALPRPRTHAANAQRGSATHGSASHQHTHDFVAYGTLRLPLLRRCLRRHLCHIRCLFCSTLLRDGRPTRTALGCLDRRVHYLCTPCTPYPLVCQSQ